MCPFSTPGPNMSSQSHLGCLTSFIIMGAVLTTFLAKTQGFSRRVMAVTLCLQVVPILGHLLMDFIVAGHRLQGNDIPQLWEAAMNLMAGALGLLTLIAFAVEVWWQARKRCCLAPPEPMEDGEVNSFEMAEPRVVEPDTPMATDSTSFLEWRPVLDPAESLESIQDALSNLVL